MSCSSSAQCSCKTGYTGKTCSSCSSGYYKSGSNCIFAALDAVLISGGKTSWQWWYHAFSKTVEIISHSGEHICTVPDLPEKVGQHHLFKTAGDNKILNCYAKNGQPPTNCYHLDKDVGTWDYHRK